MKRVSVIALLMAMVASVFAVQPARFNYQAKLTDGSGAPLQGGHTLYFNIYSGGNSTNVLGTLQYSESVNVTATNGVVNHTIGTGTPISGALTAALFRASTDFHVQVAVDTPSNTISPRTRLEPVPFALTSGDGNVQIPISSLPYTINTPGSYYITGNLTGIEGSHGITITTTAVDLDLRGYTLQGVSGSQIGINYTGTEMFRGSVSIHNGTVQGWGFIGMFVANTSGSFYNLNVVHNQVTGLEVGNGAIVENCSIRENNGYGLRLGGRSIARNNVILNNFPDSPNPCYGIDASDECLIENNVISGCGANIGAVDGGGISAATRCIIRSNTCTGNTSGDTNQASGYGIRAGNECMIFNNNCSGNGALNGGGGTITTWGIFAGQRCYVKDNICSSNANLCTGIGIEVGSYSRVENNTCANNTGTGGTGLKTQATNVVFIKNSTMFNVYPLTLTASSSHVYYAENTFSDQNLSPSVAGTFHVAGSGDRSNVTY